MKIIAHRGVWKTDIEKNSLLSFIKSAQNGFGFEIDLRDFCGEIVVSHDSPKKMTYLFENLIRYLKDKKLEVFIAINIKADGLTSKITSILEAYNYKNYAMFDMSIPDFIFSVKQGFKVLSPWSDILQKELFLEKTDGVWLDSFFTEWWDEKHLKKVLTENKKVVIVSSELHKRDKTRMWEIIKEFINKNKNLNLDNLMICTDFPFEAKLFFKSGA